MVTVAALCALCLVIGWLARVTWKKRLLVGETYEHPGCYLINNPWDPNDPITKALADGSDFMRPDTER